nr:hypothetical protein BaRGS_022946 [Batillaria attramentaria]
MTGTSCSETHFQCPGGGYCLPVFLRRNGVVDCPGREDEHDDELLCNKTCPENCTCYGLAFFCTSTFPAADFLELRFLDARSVQQHQQGAANKARQGEDQVCV